ncbi:DoxX family protein [Dokdonella sp.]|uniref:DoxX family protein n=1 Tax=Dokdonella sp. TaxID=2291710 RepID=UPI001B28CBFE|nr:DoxX family protein [Dokdonella sp.]MBO9661480.1 DoxX family protein [Dokdonella sp.]
MSDTIARGCEAVLRALTRVHWLGPLVLRLFFGYFWLETGWAKLQHLDGFTERFVEWGIPFPALSAALSAGTDFVGGLLLMLGLFTRLTAAAMAVNMIVAIALVVIKNVSSFDELVELDEFVYILIFFWLLIAGPGKASLDTWLARRLGIATPVMRMEKT